MIIMLRGHYVKNALISFQYAFPWGQETVDSMIVISDLHQHMDTKQCSELPFSEESKLHAIQIKTDLSRGIRRCPGQLTRHQLFSRLSLNGHLCKTDTPVKQTPSVGPCLSLLPLLDSL